MIAFSGLMQAVTGFAPALGDKTVSTGNQNHGLPETDDAFLPLDDPAASFLEWVRKVMDGGAPGQTADQSVLDPQASEGESDGRALDQLKRLIADAMGQTPTAPQVSQTVSAETLDDAMGQTPAAPQVSQTVSAETLDDAMGQKPTAPQVSQTLNAETLDDGYVPLAPEIRNASLAHNDGSPPADHDRPYPKNVSGMATPTGQGSGPGDENQIKANPLTSDIRENTPIEGLEKEKTPSPFKPVAPTSDERRYRTEQFIRQHPLAGQTRDPEVMAPASTADEGKDSAGRYIQPGLPSGLGTAKKTIDPAPSHQHPSAGQAKDSESIAAALTDHEGKSSTNRFVQERSPSGLRTPEKAIDPAPLNQHFRAGQAKDLESSVTALTDRKAGSSKDDTANPQGQTKPRQNQRTKAALVNENELTKAQSSDSVKRSVPQVTQSHPSFQDTAKAMAADPAQNIAVKQTAGQAATSIRTESSADRTFQTTVMDQIVDKAAMRSIHGRSEIQIRLKPEFLGNVQMNIATDKEQLVVRIVTDQPVVKEIIETHLHHLKTELHNQGLTIDKFEVMVNPDADQQQGREPFAQMFKNNSSPNGRRQPPEQNPETLDRGEGKESDDDQPNHEGVNYFA